VSPDPAAVPTDFPTLHAQVRRTLHSWPGYRTLASVLERFDDLSVFLAGGVIRNCLLGIDDPPKDFDFFLQGPSLQAALRVFQREGRLDQTPYGAPRWYPHGEVRYADLMAIEDFRPGLWRCADMIDVLNQFDFTASALALDLRSGAWLNPQNGYRDAVRRTMRMVRFDYPEGSFMPGAELNRNTVLWFRILHYASSLGLRIEPLTLAWLRRHRSYETQAVAFADVFFPLHDGYLDPL
jgi:tRNA nucleotidyltransferase (CCA-adding enzyme)